MKPQGLGWMVGGSMLLLAQAALAASGISGLDAVYQTTDTAVGATGYTLVTVGLLVPLVTFFMGHAYVALGMLALMGIGGALIGNRADIGGMMQLSLGAELVQQAPAALLGDLLSNLLYAWPLELLP